MGRKRTRDYMAVWEKTYIQPNGYTIPDIHWKPYTVQSITTRPHEFYGMVEVYDKRNQGQMKFVKVSRHAYLEEWHRCIDS